MKNVTLALNPLEPETWTNHEVSDIREFLMEQFEEWPSTARIYNEQVSSLHDVTPSSEAEVERLGELQGPFYVIVYPGEPITIIYAIVAIVVVAAVVLATQAQIPSSAMRTTESTSPNNELSERTNKPRPGGRIPDIFGTVRSTPDLLAVPYKLFINHEEVEYSYMCIGRGAYDVSDVKDDTSLVVDIAGASVEVFAPYTSPNSSAEPQLRIGTEILEPVWNAQRLNAVNGQVLRPPNDERLVGSSDIRFKTPNIIEPLSDIDFTDFFTAGDELTIENGVEYSSYSSETKAIFAFDDDSFRFEIPSTTLPAQYEAGKTITLTGALFNTYDADGFQSATYNLDGIFQIASVNLVTETITPEFGSPYDVYYCRIVLASPASVNPTWSEIPSSLGPKDVALRVPTGDELYNLSGEYTILSVSDTQLTLSNPAAVNPDWSLITTTPYLSPVLSTSGPKWVGPFTIGKDDTTRIYSNFVALNGIYKENQDAQRRWDVAVQIEVTPIDSAGNPTGAATTYNKTVEGSATSKATRAATLKITLPFVGRCKVRARRLTDKSNFKGSVVDEIKWRDVFAMSPAGVTNFGNVTTVHSVTYATAGALALKERKLNMLATRKIPLRVAGSTFTTTLYPTNKAEEIFSAICLDSRIGNRNPLEIDFDNIYETMTAVRDYFGTDKAAEFCYTFDSDNLSFEETAQAIANAVFCVAYRRGSVIKLNFEKSTEDSTLLFNHRNKLPGSETRTVRFGNQDNFDGVSYQYVSPFDDALITYCIPEDRSAINPKEVESMGVRSDLQARFHAWRIWNKIRYQNTIVEFQATQEADLLVSQDRILVADNTRPNTQDGEILQQSALLLTLSQAVTMQTGVDYSLFVQHIDGTTESIPVTPGSTTRQVLLSRAPRLPLALDDDLYARTTFILVGNNEPRENAFLVSEKSMQGNFVSTVRAVNYDARYYSNDKDYEDGVVNENGVYI